MIKYKLTTQDLKAHNGFQWEIGKKVTTDGSGELCSKGWLHCYSDPRLAILMNPIHANISNPKLFEVECSGLHKDDKGRKEGFTEMTLIKEIDIPVLTINQKIAFAIYCSLAVCKEEQYILWANNWLSGVDRSGKAAADTADTADAYYAAYAAKAAAVAVAAAAAYAAKTAAVAVNAGTIDFISIIEKALKIS